MAPAFDFLLPDEDEGSEVPGGLLAPGAGVGLPEDGGTEDVEFLLPVGGAGVLVFDGEGGAEEEDEGEAPPGVPQGGHLYSILLFFSETAALLTLRVVKTRSGVSGGLSTVHRTKILERPTS